MRTLGKSKLILIFLHQSSPQGLLGRFLLGSALSGIKGEDLSQTEVSEEEVVKQTDHLKSRKAPGPARPAKSSGGVQGQGVSL